MRRERRVLPSEDFKRASRELQKSFKRASRELQGDFKGLQGGFKGAEGDFKWTALVLFYICLNL